MARVGVTVIGDELAARKLESIGASAHAQYPAMRASAHDAARGVSGVPVATGALRASITPLQVDSYGFLVGSRLRYAPFVFGGTSKMAARPPRPPRDVASSTARRVGASVVRGR